MKPTKMASVLKNKPSEVGPFKAVDGNRMNGLDNNCAATDGGKHDWWLVDLQAIYLIREVVISNREDTFCESE